jgi:hypothetical protein
MCPPKRGAKWYVPPKEGIRGVCAPLLWIFATILPITNITVVVIDEKNYDFYYC